MILSIITINYNNAHGLAKTLKSVLSQTNTQFEHVIVDGEINLKMLLIIGNIMKMIFGADI